MNCRRCGKPKPPGQGRKFCSDECRDAGPAEGARRCTQCNRKRLVPAEIGPKARYCGECLKERARAQARARYHANPEKVRAAVAAYKQANAEEVKAKKREHYRRNREKIRAKQAEYAAAHREEQRARSRAWYEANRERHKEATERYRQAHREIVRQRNRRWYDAVMADPERRQRRQEMARMDARLRQERAGRPLRPLSPKEYIERYGTGQLKNATRIPAGPIRQLLNEHVDDLTGFAEALPLSESLIDRIMQGHKETVAVRDADILCVALNLPLRLVYPDEYEQVAQIA